MRRFNAMPLRLRLTALMAMILTIACIILLLISILGARRVYDDTKAPVTPGILFGDKGQDIGVDPFLLMPRARQVRQNNDFAAIGVVSALLVIILGTALTYVIAGKALKPVTNLSKEIEDIDEHRLFRQVDISPSNDEVARLSISFNRMIHRLEKAFLAHKNFSASAAHELKTPLAAMIANLEVLQLDANPTLDDYKETTDEALRNAQRLSELVGDLLKMNAELNSQAFERFEAGAMLEEIIGELRREVRSKGLHVENAVGAARLYGDKPLLYRAFANLIHNAVKYNRPGGVIKVAAAENGRQTRITILDTGIGIPEDQIDKIFDPFYCVDKSRSRELGGSGLGLSIVKSVIEKHGGDIKVRSEVNVYTSVVVTLPVPQTN